MQVLGYLRCLPGAGFALDDENLMVPDCLYDVIPERVNGQTYLCLLYVQPLSLDFRQLWFFFLNIFSYKKTYGLVKHIQHFDVGTLDPVLVQIYLGRYINFKNNLKGKQKQ